jgi:hypothetical protein
MLYEDHGYGIYIGLSFFTKAPHHENELFAHIAPPRQFAIIFNVSVAVYSLLRYIIFSREIISFRSSVIYLFDQSVSSLNINSFPKVSDLVLDGSVELQIGLKTPF